MSRLEGDDNPVQLIYFVEDQDGERLSAVKSSDLINKIDLQRAAIILGYRIQGAIAQRKSQLCWGPRPGFSRHKLQCGAVDFVS